MGLGFGVSGLGFIGFRLWGIGFRVDRAACRDDGFVGFRGFIGFLGFPGFLVLWSCVASLELELLEFGVGSLVRGVWSRGLRVCNLGFGVWGLGFGV